MRGRIYRFIVVLCTVVLIISSFLASGVVATRKVPVSVKGAEYYEVNITESGGYTHMVWAMAPEGEEDKEVYYVNNMSDYFIDTLEWLKERAKNDEQYEGMRNVILFMLDRAIEISSQGDYEKAIAFCHPIIDLMPEYRDILVNATRSLVFSNLLYIDYFKNNTHINIAWRHYYFGIKMLKNEKYHVFLAMMEESVHHMNKVSRVCGYGEVVRVTYTKGNASSPIVTVSDVNYGKRYDDYVYFVAMPALHIMWYENDSIYYARSTNKGHTWWYVDAIKEFGNYLQYLGFDIDAEIIDITRIIIAAIGIVIIDGCHTYYAIVGDNIVIVEMPDGGYPHVTLPSRGSLRLPIHVVCGGDGGDGGGGAPPQPPAVDIYASDLYIVEDGPYKEDYTYTVNGKIKNTGSADIGGKFSVKIAGKIKDVYGLNAGEVKTVSASWTPSTGGSKTIAMYADYYDDVAESNENNNKKTINVYVKPKYEFKVSDITFPSNVVLGQTCNVGITVKNDGYLSANVGVKLSEYAGGKWQVIGTKSVSVSGGGSATCYIQWTPEHAGNRKIKATVDYSNNYEELNENNNERSESVYVKAPDLIVKSVSIDYYYGVLIEGVPTKITAVIKNQGDWDAGSFYVKFEAYNAATGAKVEDIGQIRVSSLAAGSEKTITVSWTPGLAIEYLIKVIVDFLNAVKEALEHNNVHNITTNRTLPADGDYDDDGLRNAEEAYYGTSPVDPDTDDDSFNHAAYDGKGDFNDGVEVNYWKSLGYSVETIRKYATDDDVDDDGCYDGVEILYWKSDPFNKDTDNDGVIDFCDFNPVVDIVVSVKIERIAQVDDVDPWKGEAEFYFKVYISGMDGFWVSDIYEGDDISPNVVVSWNVDDNRTGVSGSGDIQIVIELWESDWPDNDDFCDLDSYGTANGALDLNYYPSGFAIFNGAPYWKRLPDVWNGDDEKGDKDGYGYSVGDGGPGDWPRCEIWFEIYDNGWPYHDDLDPGDGATWYNHGVWIEE